MKQKQLNLEALRATGATGPGVLVEPASGGRWRIIRQTRRAPGADLEGREASSIALAALARFGYRVEAWDNVRLEAVPWDGKPQPSTRFAVAEPDEVQALIDTAQAGMVLTVQAGEGGAYEVVRITPPLPGAPEQLTGEQVDELDQAGWLVMVFDPDTLRSVEWQFYEGRE